MIARTVKSPPFLGKSAANCLPWPPATEQLFGLERVAHVPSQTSSFWVPAIWLLPPLSTTHTWALSPGWLTVADVTDKAAPYARPTIAATARQTAAVSREREASILCKIAALRGRVQGARWRRRGNLSRERRLCRSRPRGEDRLARRRAHELLARRTAGGSESGLATGDRPSRRGARRLHPDRFQQPARPHRRDRRVPRAAPARRRPDHRPRRGGSEQADAGGPPARSRWRRRQAHRPP